MNQADQDCAFIAVRPGLSLFFDWIMLCYKHDMCLRFLQVGVRESA